MGEQSISGTIPKPMYLRLVVLDASTLFDLDVAVRNFIEQL